MRSRLVGRLRGRRRHRRDRNVSAIWEKGMTPLRATIEGARQIGFTVLSISISLVAAFTALAFSWAGWSAGCSASSR